MSGDPVLLVEYRPDWPSRFAAERERLVQSLPEAHRVEHVGSTAVPGLAAKDCIDVLVVVPADGALDEATGVLVRLGYEYRPGSFASDPGHRFLRRVESGVRTHHLHLLVDGNPHIRSLIALRDFLRDHSTARRRYATVKRRLARATPDDRAAYIAGKSPVVADLTEQALEWCSGIASERA